jgi:uncharacterized Zn finger protein
MHQSTVTVSGDSVTVLMDWLDLKCTNCGLVERVVPTDEDHAPVFHCRRCGHDNAERVNWRATFQGRVYGPR